MNTGWLAAPALALLALAAPAAASPIATCGASTLARVERATACIFDTAFTNDSESVVNRLPGREDGYFGFKDWDKVARDDDDDHSGRRGEYDFTDIATGGANMFMLVFKSGSSRNSPSLIAYLVPKTEGDWATPFTRDPFPNHPRDGRDVSHVSYYVRTAAFAGPAPGPGPGPVPDVPILAASVPVPVPEPGTLALFALGMAGLVASRLRRAG